MVRLLVIFALWAMVFPDGASAIEMQTNFHYGEQVGFPPMEVPTAVYGGWGTPGWNCSAINRVPLYNAYPPVPAMFPTGCNPGGCNYCNGVWSGYQQKAFHKRINTRWYYGNVRGEPLDGPEPIASMESAPDDADAISEPETISVIQPHPASPQPAPTPANPAEVKPNKAPAVPRTTGRIIKPIFRRGTSG
ncbi:MAG: hypothetical protein IT427_00070 [Pirellulales bacterium]|nr:hypothetical protein [Pirellulales bacterium]